MPNTREKLIELISQEQYLGGLEEKVADHLIANGVTIQKWIPVTERLPEGKGRYLCNVKSFSFPGSFYQTILTYDKYGFIEGRIYTDAVTRWMPLPEPPTDLPKITDQTKNALEKMGEKAHGGE